MKLLLVIFSSVILFSEVQKAVNSVQELYKRWKDLLSNPNTVGKEEYNWTVNEIKNSIRSVEWDLEDLEETIGIVESNPNKFTLAPNDINDRKHFIRETRKNIQTIKDEINSPETKSRLENGTRQVNYPIASCTIF